MITLDTAKSLTHGTILYHCHQRNADGSPQRWRVNGRPRTWVRSPERVKVPVKHGLWDYDYVTEYDLGLICLTESDAMDQGQKSYKVKSVTFNDPQCKTRVDQVD